MCTAYLKTIHVSEATTRCNSGEGGEAGDTTQRGPGTSLNKSPVITAR